MTGLEFLSATIGQLIWPVMLLVLVLILKGPIRQLLQRPMTRLKAGPGGVELEFERALKEAESEASETPPELPGRAAPSSDLPLHPGPVVDFLESMRKLAQIQPRSVVLEAHSKLEGLLREVLDAPAPNVGRRYMSMSRLTADAVERGLLEPGDASALTELTYLRNQVAHIPEQAVSFDQAMRYANVAVQIAISVRLAQGRTVADGTLF